MELSTIKDKIEAINGAVTGITKSLDSPPDDLPTAWIPCIFPMLRNFETSYAANGLGRFDLHFVLQLWGDAIGQNMDVRTRLAKLDPFPERLRDAYAAHIKLDSTVDQCALTGGRFAVMAYGQIEHAMIEFDLDVVVKDAVTVGL